MQGLADQGKVAVQEQLLEKNPTPLMISRKKRPRQPPKALRNADSRAFLARRRGRGARCFRNQPMELPHYPPKSQPFEQPLRGPMR